MKAKILVLFLFIPLFISAQDKITVQLGYKEGIQEVTYSIDTRDIIYAYKSDVLSINGLEKLPNLKSISLIGLPDLQDISFLQFCNGLETVIIDSCSKLVNIDSLFSIPTIKSIMIRGCPRLGLNDEILLDLKRMDNLVYLQIADSNITAVQIKDNIPNSLKYLNLSGNKMKKAEFVDSIPEHVWISLFGNPLIVKPSKKNVYMNINDFLANTPVEYLQTY